MTKKIIILRANGGIEIADVGEVIELKQLQDAVGGHIEVVHPRYGYGHTMIVNEEGKIEGLPINVMATALVMFLDDIVGDVVLCKADGEELVGYGLVELAEVLHLIGQCEDVIESEEEEDEDGEETCETETDEPDA